MGKVVNSPAALGRCAASDGRPSSYASSRVAARPASLGGTGALRPVRQSEVNRSWMDPSSKLRPL